MDGLSEDLLGDVSRILNEESSDDASSTSDVETSDFSDDEDMDGEETWIAPETSQEDLLVKQHLIAPSLTAEIVSNPICANNVENTPGHIPPKIVCSVQKLLKLTGGVL